MAAELKLFNSKGKETGTAQGSAAVFATPTSLGTLHSVVRWQRAKRRAGTHSVKTRAEASGGGRKPWRQKGTGNARAGSNTSPLWVGGGIAHGPKPRSYEFSLNRKQRRLALCGALSSRVADGKCYVVEDFALSEAKTKKASEILTSLGLERGTRVAVIVTDSDEASQKSFRNLPRVRVLSVSGLNVYDLLGAEYVVMTKQALADVETRLSAVGDKPRAVSEKPKREKSKVKKAKELAA